MLRVRREEERDRARIYDLVTRAFGRENEAKLVDALRAATPPADFISLVAERAGELQGHVLFSPITVDHHTPAIALAPVAVEPAAQKSGLGTALIRAGLDACREAGHAIVVVVGHANYYPRFGFLPARPFGLELPFPASDEVFMALELRPGALKSVRGTIQYPAPFLESE